MKTVYSTEDPYIIFRSPDSPRIHICIDGRKTGSCKCVGYCRFYGHPGYLTKELRKNHNCVKKGCSYYVSKKARPAAQIREKPFAALAVLL